MAADSPENTTVPTTIVVQIDRSSYRVRVGKMTGAELRQLPSPPLDTEYDLFIVSDEASEDTLLSASESVELREGMRFFSVPRTVLAG